MGILKLCANRLNCEENVNVENFQFILEEKKRADKINLFCKNSVHSYLNLKIFRNTNIIII